MRILFDADSLVYGCGFAAQKTLYDWTATNGRAIEEGIAPGAEALAEVRALLPEGWTLEAFPVVEAEPRENALALAKRQLYRVEEDLEKAGLKFERLALYLTGKGNWRDEVAKVRPYKGNRIGMEKPIHYPALRRYLRTRWGATVIHGREADDQVAIESYALGHDPAKVIIVSQDKDLRTVPGLLYNYRKREFELITERAASFNFYTQLLVGDLTDNIVGCYKVGAAGAAKLLSTEMTDRQMYEVVLEQYRLSQAKKGCEYADLPAEDVILEFGKLLHMERYEGDRWQVPA